MSKNNNFIFDAAVQFEQLTGIAVVVDGSQKEFDAVFSIDKLQFIVTAKPEIRTSNKGVILSQIKETEKRFNRPVLVIAKFIASDIAQEFQRNAINYLDVSGNTFIRRSSFFILITGQKVKKPEKLNQSRAFQEAGIKLIFNLLVNPGYLQYSYRELAELTGISIGSVSNVIKEMEDLNFILKTDTKRVLKNKPELLNRWIVAYQDVLRPRLIKRKMRFADKATYNNWKAVIQNRPDNSFLWGGEPAAALLTNYLKPALYKIYTNKTWQECVKILEMVPDENGDIEILTVFWKKESSLRDLPVVPAVLVYADLINSGFDRNLETAKIILDNDLQNIK